MKPICQIYSLILEQLEGYIKGDDYYEKKYKFLLRTKTKEKAVQKIIDLKMEETCDIILGELIRDIDNKRKGITKMTHFFRKK